MGVEIVLPEMGAKKSVKDLVISILTDDWPLTLKRIYNQIKKRYAVSVTYQAVHKAINELKEKGVIKKEGKVYLIDKKWIENIKDFSEKLEKSYEEERPLSKIKEGFSVNTIWELWPIFIEAFKKDIFNSNNKSVCYVGHLVLNPQLGSEKQIEDYQELAKKYKFFMVATSHSLLNKIWKSYWEKLGVKVKIGAKLNSNPSIDIFVVGNFIIQIFHPEKIIEKENKLREKVKKVSDINIKDIHDIYFKNYGKIHVIAIKNKELSSQLRNEVELLFKKR